MSIFTKTKPLTWMSVKAWVKTALLIGMGLYLSYIILTGLLTNYINTRFLWLSYVAAGLFLLIGGINLLYLLRADPKQANPLKNEHQRISWFAIAVVTVPLLFGTLVPSNPLGAAAVNGNLSTSATTYSSWTIADIPSTERNVLDWLRLISVTDDLSQLETQQADVIGFVYTEADYDAQSFMVVRFTINCCVADAGAIGLPVIWSESANLEQGTWVRVRGSMELGSFKNVEQLLLQATTVEIVEQPENPYLYP